MRPRRSKEVTRSMSMPAPGPVGLRRPRRSKEFSDSLDWVAATNGIVVPKKSSLPGIHAAIVAHQADADGHQRGRQTIVAGTGAVDGGDVATQKMIAIGVPELVLGNLVDPRGRGCLGQFIETMQYFATNFVSPLLFFCYGGEHEITGSREQGFQASVLGPPLQIKGGMEGLPQGTFNFGSVIQSVSGRKCGRSPGRDLPIAR